MWILVGIVLVAGAAVLLAALGLGWGPAVLGCGFAFWAAFIVISGLKGPFPLLGIVYAVAALGEFGTALAFWRWQEEWAAHSWRQPRRRRNPLTKRPPGSWRATAALVGAGGSAGALAILFWLIAGTIASLAR